MKKTVAQSTTEIAEQFADLCAWIARHRASLVDAERRATRMQPAGGGFVTHAREALEQFDRALLRFKRGGSPEKLKIDTKHLLQRIATWQAVAWMRSEQKRPGEARPDDATPGVDLFVAIRRLCKFRGVPVPDLFPADRSPIDDAIARTRLLASLPVDLRHEVGEIIRTRATGWDVRDAAKQIVKALTGEGVDRAFRKK